MGEHESQATHERAKEILNCDLYIESASGGAMPLQSLLNDFTVEML